MSNFFSATVISQVAHTREWMGGREWMMGEVGQPEVGYTFRSDCLD